MEPRHFLLRVYSVKEDRGGPETHDPMSPTWEVRADADAGLKLASIFYHENNPRNLPRLDSLIHVTVDEQITEEGIDTCHETAQRHMSISGSAEGLLTGGDVILRQDEEPVSTSDAPSDETPT